MSDGDRPALLDPGDKRRFCRQVLESLSDLIEGEAPEDFCRQVDRVLGECEPYLAYRATLEETVRMARQLGRPVAASETDEELYLRCVEKVRQRLEAGTDG